MSLLYFVSHSCKQIYFNPVSHIIVKIISLITTVIHIKNICKKLSVNTKVSHKHSSQIICFDSV